MLLSYGAPPANSMGRDGRVAQTPFPQALKQSVHIDSRDRDYSAFPSSAAFTVDLPAALHGVTNAVLISAELPMTYYVFSAARGNTSVEFGVDGTYETVTIPDGNYTSTTLAAALKTALDAAHSPATFTVAVDPGTQKVSVTGTGTLTVDGTGATSATNWGLGYYLGFQGGVVSSGSGTLTGSSIVQVNPENYILLDVENLNGHAQTSTYSVNGGGGGRAVFAKIPLNGDTYQYNFYDKTLSYVEMRPPLSRLQKLKIALRFHDGTTVDLNGGEWSMTIEFASTLARQP